MANSEHLAILKQGVEVWNKWRGEYDALGPDLRIRGQVFDLSGETLNRLDSITLILAMLTSQRPISVMLG